MEGGKMRKIIVAACCFLALAVFAGGGENERVYIAAEYPELHGMPGFSEQLVSNHLRLYGASVKNSNEISGKLSSMLESGKERSIEYAELKRRFGYEFNGMRLHEYYFAGLGGDGRPLEKSLLYGKITEVFGSFEKWKRDFSASGLIRGTGWVVLYEDAGSGALFNVWINEHDTGHLCGGKPLLIMDVFEHAYMPDYQLDRQKYIDAFFSNLNWKEISGRFAP